MVDYFAVRSQVSYGEETTIGTKATTSTNWIGLIDSLTLPEESAEFQKFWSIGYGRDYAAAAEGKHTLTGGSFECVMQKPDFLFFPFGTASETGTDVGSGGGSTLDGAIAAGDTAFDVVAATNYAVADNIEVGVGVSPEIRTITDVTSNTITVSKPFRRAHLTGATCNEVTTPYTHTLSIGQTLTSFTLEAAVNASTNFVRFYDGCFVDTVDLSATVGDALKANFGYMAQKTEAAGTSVSTVTTSTTTPYMFDEGVITCHGGAIATVEDFKLSMKNGLTQQHYITSTNGLLPQVTVPGKREITFTITAVPTAATWWGYLASNPAATTLSAKFSRSATDYIDIQATGVRLLSGPTNIPADGLLKAELSYIAQTCSIESIDATPYY